MPTLCKEQPTTFHVFFAEPVPPPITQGAEGKKLADMSRGIFHDCLESWKHWIREDEFDYSPIPPKRSFTMYARYKIRGRGKPPSYQVENFE